MFEPTMLVPLKHHGYSVWFSDVISELSPHHLVHLKSFLFLFFYIWSILLGCEPFPLGPIVAVAGLTYIRLEATVRVIECPTVSHACSATPLVFGVENSVKLMAQGPIMREVISKFSCAHIPDMRRSGPHGYQGCKNRCFVVLGFK